jgi:hypothetical protein
MYAWRPYAREIAEKLWAAFVEGARFEDWEREWLKGSDEAPIDFFVQDKRARFSMRGKFDRKFTLKNLDDMAVAAGKHAGTPVDWLRVDNSSPGQNIVTITFELSRLRVTASEFKPVSQ